ncbi:transcription elongation factor, mitochondrial isoform X3 [Macrobrachium rosenbergii]|uniref:transcription elongation factor, mitochondrial isoform X3 n=1 Tax=Macrobrachium rosenbergii TaxID=79674 RepID=UPI0034D59E3C
MSSYLTIPRKFLQRPAVLYVLQNHGFSTKEHTGKQTTKVYDLTQYEFSYSAEETQRILEILNHSSEEAFFEFKITKGMAKKLIKGRSQLGTFQNVSQLLNIDGFGLKNVENICDKVLNEKPSQILKEEEFVQSKVLIFKKLVKPRVEPQIIKEMETLLAIDVMVGGLSWTLLDRHGVLIDVGYEELLSKGQRFDAPKIYDKMRGILTALLDIRQEGKKGGNLFYLRDILVSKLFNLKVGGERICGLNLADQIMQSEKILDWLPPLELNNETQEKYFSIDKVQRKYISTSLFISLAFYQTVIENNVLSHKVLIEG